MASKNRDSVVLIADNTVSGEAYTAHLAMKVIPASCDRNTLGSHLLKMVGSDFPEGESVADVWRGSPCGRSYSFNK